MTTIAYTSGIMASDMAVTESSDHVCNIRKIAKIKGYLIGGCGDMDLVYWFLKAFKPDVIMKKLRIAPPVNITDKDGFEGLIVSPGGKIYIFTDKLIAVPVNTFGYMAIGSGTPVAMGAMFAGGSAKTAVRAAMKHDKNTGGRLQFIRL